jgi:ATP-dependent RNA helicase DeaD
MTNFDAIVPAIAEALRKRGYETLTPVQEAMIDPELLGRDALVSAQTGSGKTVAFGLAMAPTLLEGESRFGRAGKPLALAIAPTRELAMQVQRELEWLYAETGAIIGSCVGGMDIRNERRALERGAHIIVGTPGRLRDHITRRALDLSELKVVVLDEADEMLDLGSAKTSNSSSKNRRTIAAP